jgi:splicing factor U2AF subunit
MAIQGLHGFQLGDRTLVVAQAILQSANATDAPSSRVMLLLNMVTPEELYDDAEYEDILADINDECGKYGEIEGVRVPRPVPKSKKWESTEGTALTAEKNRKLDAENGVGRVYVMYKDIDSATKAMKALGGRQFAGRTILVANVPEVSRLGRLSCPVVRYSMPMLTRNAGGVPRTGAATTPTRGYRGRR